MPDLGEPPPRPSTARMSMPPMAALEDLSRPRAIAVSFWSWFVGSVLLAGVAAVTATKADAMHTEFARLARENDADASQKTIDSVAGASVLVVIGAGVLLALLGVTLCWGVRAARGWARIFLTVVGIAGVAYAALVSSALTDPMLEDLRGPVTVGLLVYTALVVVATLCMYLRGTGAWFRRPRAR
jgi:heme/copper-type cytochrome/quinol oxidase subunit 1